MSLEPKKEHIVPKRETIALSSVLLGCCSAHGYQNCYLQTQLCHFDDFSAQSIFAHHLWSLKASQILKNEAKCYADLQGSGESFWLKNIFEQIFNQVTKLLPFGLRKYFSAGVITLVCFPNRDECFPFAQEVYPVCLADYLHVHIQTDFFPPKQCRSLYFRSANQDQFLHFLNKCLPEKEKVSGINLLPTASTAGAGSYFGAKFPHWSLWFKFPGKTKIENITPEPEPSRRYPRHRR